MTATQLYIVLADDPTADDVKPGWIALVIVLAMAVALALLMRSMVKQFRKVDFDEDADPVAREEAADRSRDADEHRANGSAQP